MQHLKWLLKQQKTWKIYQLLPKCTDIVLYYYLHLMKLKTLKAILVFSFQVLYICTLGFCIYTASQYVRVVVVPLLKGKRRSDLSYLARCKALPNYLLTVYPSYSCAVVQVALCSTDTVMVSGQQICKNTRLQSPSGRIKFITQKEITLLDSTHRSLTENRNAEGCPEGEERPYC